MRTTLLLTFVLALFACDALGQSPLPVTQGVLEPMKNPSEAGVLEQYHWLGSTYAMPERVLTLNRAFVAPSGFTRVEVASKSFGQYLRTLPVLVDRQHVESYKGARLSSPSAAIIAIDVGQKNLQQCADSAIRLHAEYLWSQKRYSDIAYHFTSGDRSAWPAWQKGERFKVTGSSVARVRGRRVANNHAAFRDYLEHTYRYAGTRSLHRDSKAVKLADAQPGDFFVSPGSPGHAVVILDIVESGEQRLALIGQGFMPAQDFHVVRASNTTHAVDKVWFKLPASDGKIHTPSWAAFDAGELRRFSD